MTDIITILDRLLTSRHDEVEQWLAAERRYAAPYIYTSVDLRHAKFKLVPVDTNLYPAGFNNLSLAAKGRAVRRFSAFFDERGLKGRPILIVPENHTRNLGYLENLYVLQEIISATGAMVQIGSLAALAGEKLQLATLHGNTVIQHPLVREGNILKTEEGFVPAAVVLNNDLTGGVPDILKGISQMIEPPLSMGWYQRRKTVHFTAYSHIAEKFAQHFGIDPWLISTDFHYTGLVNFAERHGLEAVAVGVEEVLEKTRAKYKEYGISNEPYVFIKADSGTYGMGIMTVRSGDELYEINKKTRNKMSTIKEGAQNSEVIIQEGVPTIDTVDGKSAEPMMYLVDGVPVGGAYRVNATRDALSNLNASGMEFAGMCDEAETPDGRIKVTGCNFRVFGVIAALAALAAANEEKLQNIGGGI